MPQTSNIGGQLIPLKLCYIDIPGATCISSHSIQLNALPDISDSKSASYSDEAVMGRSNPLKTYAHSENRAISFTIHLYVVQPSDINLNLCYLHALESAVYPRTQSSGSPFVPPPICTIQCGSLLASDASGNPASICAVLKSYSVRFPTDVAWDEHTYMPYKLDIDTSWEVVYSAVDLPGAERIMKFGA